MATFKLTDIPKEKEDRALDCFIRFKIQPLHATKDFFRLMECPLQNLDQLYSGQKVLEKLVQEIEK